MKPKEALKYLELIDNVTIDYTLAQHRELDFDKAEELASEAINIAYEALESHVPMVPLNKRIANEEYIGSCPACKLRWNVGNWERYCSNCGQKLDWR